MSAAQTTTAVRIRHLPTHGRGTHVQFSGDDAVAVLAAATGHWATCDEWLRGPAPIVAPCSDGTYAADVRVWSGE